MRYYGFLTLCFIITIVLIPSSVYCLNSEYNKNGEVYMLLQESSGQIGCAVPGIYKLCEYQVDTTGKRSVMVAKESDVLSKKVAITRDSGYSESFGIAVNKDRTCYTFSEQAEKDWKSAPVGTYTVTCNVATSKTGSGRWYAGGCSGTPNDYFKGGCGAAHTSSGHQRGNFVWWRQKGGRGNDKFYCRSTFAPTMKFNKSGDEVTNIGDNYVVFPCSLAYQNWSGDPWPLPVGATTTRTLKGKKRKISKSGKYVMPSGMWFHDGSDRKHTYFPGAGMMLMYAAAVKYRNLKQHQYIPKNLKPTAWTTTSASVPGYRLYTPDQIVFQLFDAKFHIFRATPCGDGCLPGKAAKEVQMAGNSRISISITPFGRSYGLQVINDKNVKLVSIKRSDPIYNASGIITGTKKPVEYKPADWKNKKPTLHLKVLNTTGSTLSYTNWLDAKKIATSYKFKSSEPSFADKEEYVYICDSEFFCVSDTWFGNGGRAFSGDFGKDGKLLVRNESRDEVASKFESKYFKITGNVQDIASDGYGNFFYLCSTDLDAIGNMMDKNTSSMDNIKKNLDKKDKWGFPIAEKFKDTGWKLMFGETKRIFTFDVPIYKTVYKISQSNIGEKATKKTTGAPDLGDPFGSLPPEVVGRVRIGTNKCSRSAIKSGAKIVWQTSKLVVEGADYTKKKAEIASINIAAPPEEQGWNYYIDIKGPNSERTPADYKTRAGKCTDIVFENETLTWSMENAPEFDEVYGLNIINGTEDQNGNDIIGGLRNNIIKESLMYHWMVYHLYNIKNLALPPISENETFASQTAAGDYSQNLLHEAWCIYKGTGDYERIVPGKGTITNNAEYKARPGKFISSYPDINHPSPSELSFEFKEAGIYKVCLEVEFDYYNYSSMSFGENRSQRGNYKKSCKELPASPGYYNPPNKKNWPVFNHRLDSRFVVVLARDALADGKYIKGVSVNKYSGGTVIDGGHIVVDEVKRDPLFNEVLNDYTKDFDPDKDTFSVTEIKAGKNKALRSTMFKGKIDVQRMTKMDIVGDFAIKFVGSVPDRGDTGNDKDPNLAERFSGVGEWDYVPDEASDAGDALVSGSTNSKTPPNYKSNGTSGTADFTILGLNKATTIKDDSGTITNFTPDLKAFILRNYGMHGHGTICRSLSQEKLDFLQKNMPPGDPFRKKIISVKNSLWNDQDGAKFPIRKIDWNNVKYSWYISYKINGKVYIEEPDAYKGSIMEIMTFLESQTKSERVFIKRLGKKRLPFYGNGYAASSQFNIDGYTIDSSNVPAFHVRFPMLEKCDVNGDGKWDTFKPVRWETPIGPEEYHIGLKISAPTVEWKRHDTYVERDMGAGSKTDLQEKQVFWDLVPGDPDEAKCGPTNIDDAKQAINESREALRNKLKSKCLWSTVFVNDNELPRFALLNDSTDVSKMFTYEDGSTGDKYSARDMEFIVVDNNPNCNPKLYGAINSTEMKMQFPLADDIKEKQAERGGAGSKHSASTEYELTLPSDGYALKSEGSDAFGFEPTGDSEMWGAPYSSFKYVLPVADSMGDITIDGLRTKNTKTTPFMYPDYTGDMKYDLSFKLSTTNGSGKDESGSLDYKRLAKYWMFFKVADNDPPNVMVRVRTSFTEKDEFGISVTDLPFEFSKFTTPSLYTSSYKGALEGEDPTSWPKAIVDAKESSTSKADFGQSYLSIMDVAGTSRIPSDTEKEADGNDVDIKHIFLREPDYMIYIPEKSRAVFSITAVDNVPSKSGRYQIYLEAGEGADNLEWEVVDQRDSNPISPAMTNFKDVLEASDDPEDNTKSIKNLFGTFRIPMEEDEKAVIKITVYDNAKKRNKRVIQIPINVLNTYLKKKRLDLDKRKINQ